jgi:hypothetical protein
MENSLDPPEHRWPGIPFDWMTETRLAVAALIRRAPRHRTPIALHWRLHFRTWDLPRPYGRDDGICTEADIRPNTITFIFLDPVNDIDFLRRFGECLRRWVVGDIGATVA